MEFGTTTSCVRTVDLIRNTSEISFLADEAFHFLDTAEILKGECNLCNLYVRSLIFETTSKVFVIVRVFSLFSVN